MKRTNPPDPSRFPLVALIRKLRWHLSLRWSRLLDRSFDRSFGTDTAGIIENRDQGDVTSPTRARGIRYEPTRAAPFSRALRTAGLPAGGTFVDLGCGRGRVLMLAALYGFRKLTGVDYSPALCRTATSNLEILRRSHGLDFEHRMIAGDAAGYDFEPDDAVIFLFNPFDDTVLRAVMSNLTRSIDAHPRRVWIIYHRPVWREAITGGGVFSLTREIESGATRFAFFSNRAG
jgi:SAM-dependent methyltransferase